MNDDSNLSNESDLMKILLSY